jgi:hypothetical protein
MGVLTIADVAVLEPPAAMKYLIVVIAIMMQRLLHSCRIISRSIKSSDTIFLATKLKRLYAHFVALNKRLSKSVQIVVYAWLGIFVELANCSMMIHQNGSIIVMAVASAELAEGRISSIASNADAATQRC